MNEWINSYCFSSLMVWELFCLFFNYSFVGPLQINSLFNRRHTVSTKNNMNQDKKKHKKVESQKLIGLSHDLVLIFGQCQNFIFEL